ncbi:MAG TPA: hypothetical protein IAC15_02930 [Candidatus Onthomonas avicola]|nr:hypothetical protein [Candidatus Onthomonas avicola]
MKQIQIVYRVLAILALVGSIAALALSLLSFADRLPFRKQEPIRRSFQRAEGELRRGNA